MSVPLLPRALALSIGLHVAVGAVALQSAAALFHAEPPATDVWNGQAVEVDSVSTPDEGASPAAADRVPPAVKPEENPVLPEPEPSKSEASTAEVSLEAPAAKPKPKQITPAPSPRPATSAASSSAEPSSSAEAGARGALGTVGLPAGVRHLAYAFTRAFPLASSGDEGWLTLAPGPAGNIEVLLSVDAEGKLGELVYPNREAAARTPLPVRHAVERIVLVLKSGVFSISPDQKESGVQRLRVEFQVSDVASDGSDPEQKGFQPPSPGRPGKTHFTLSSGRRVEAKVFLLP